MLKDLEKLEGRMFSVEKTVGMRTPAGDLAAQLPDRAASSGANANFRELSLKLEKILVEHERFAKWVSESIGGINEEQVSLAERISRLQSGRGSQAVDRFSGPDSPQDWHEAIDEVHRKTQDLSCGVQRQCRDHDDVIARFETVKSHVEQYEARSWILNQVLDDIRRQIRNLLASTLNGMNNRIMAQLSDIEGHVDEAADRIQGVQQNQQSPQGPRERRNIGYNAFAGQGHRIRSPTPTPGEGNGRGGLPTRTGGGVGLTDHALPTVPDRVDPSRADRHPIHPDGERADSRSGRARGGHTPCQGGTFQFPVETGARGLLPSLQGIWSGIGNRGGKGRISPNPDRPVRDSGSVSPNPNRNPGGGRVSRAHADTQSPGDSWRTPASRAHADIQSPGDSWRTPGTPSDRGRVLAPAARGTPGTGGPSAPKICALDNPNDCRHPDAEFTCATCSREFCRLCEGEDGDCCNCHFLKIKCWACRKNAQEVSGIQYVRITFFLVATALSDVRDAIRGVNGLRRWAKVDRPAKAEVVVMDLLHSGGGQGPAGPPGGPSGGAPTEGYPD